MKQKWLSESECTACGACANVCPVDAIELKKNKEGFLYPEIAESCIDCNLCQKTCELNGLYAKNNCKKPKTYAVWSKDEKIRFFSTSGGAFSELARVILQRGGCVVGAQYNDECLVEHAVVFDEEDLGKIRQSKYVQSEIGLVFREIKKLLLDGRWVAFCGTPCQVAGLYAYLGKEYDKLVTMDFICRGINSSKAYKAWLNELEEKQQSKVKQVWFKYKMGGWKKSPRCTRIDFVNDSYIVLDQEENIYMMGYLVHNLYIRPSCGTCKYKGVPRQGDLTLADFWGLDEKVDDDKGASMVLINSDKGESLFGAAKEKLCVCERTFEEIFAGNACFNSSVYINPKSEEFLLSLDEMPFSMAVEKYSKQMFWKVLKNYLLKYMKKIKRLCEGLIDRN